MHEFDYYKRFISEISVVYDIGAHVGEMSILFSKQTAHVCAFEPSPNNFPILKSNCEHLGIKCFDVALHEKEYICETQFKDCKTDFINANGIKIDTTQVIRYVLLENFIKENGLNMPDFIKLDIEGMESLVLKTFKFLFDKTRPIIYAELHAKPETLNIQDYPNNPHWRWPHQGGFDFNNLNESDYRIYDPQNNCFLTGDLNPKPGTHKGFILIPKEYEFK